MSSVQVDFFCLSQQQHKIILLVLKLETSKICFAANKKKENVKMCVDRGCYETRILNITKQTQ